MTKAKQTIQCYAVFVSYNQGEKRELMDDERVLEDLYLPALEVLVQKYHGRVAGRTGFKEAPEEGMPSHSLILAEFRRWNSARWFEKKCKSLEGVIDVGSCPVYSLPEPTPAERRAIYSTKEII